MHFQERFTASEIHEILCRADALAPAHQSGLHNRVRYLSKTGLLQNGEQVDKRGTLAFPKIEIFRAAIFCELANLTMDVRALGPVTAAAERRHSLGMNNPPSLKTDGGWQSRGGLRDSIRGVQMGEIWFLFLQQVLSRDPEKAGLHAEFAWNGAEDPERDARVDRIFGGKLFRTRATVDLSGLYGGILAVVGAPE